MFRVKNRNKEFKKLNKYQLGSDPTVHTEEIVLPLLDEVISYENSNKQGVNPCEHYRILSQYTPLPKVEILDSDGTLECVYWNFAPYLGIDPISVINPLIDEHYQGAFVHDWDLLIKAMLGTLKNRQFSLINTILELDDVGRTAKAARSTIRTATSAIGKLNLSQTDKNFLAYKYGALPMVSDVKHVAKQLFSWRSRLRKFYESVNKSKRFTRLKPLLLRKVITQWPYELEVEALVQHRWGGHFLTIWEEPSWLLNWKFTLDSLGANFDLRTLYDALPFSFIADWYMPFGEALEGRENIIPGLDNGVKEYGWLHPSRIIAQNCFTSVKISYAIRVKMIDFPYQFMPPGRLRDFGKSATGLGYVATLRGKYYRRERADAYFDGIDVPKFKPFDFSGVSKNIPVLLALFSSQLIGDKYRRPLRSSRRRLGLSAHEDALQLLEDSDL